jgi:hypothetical protein
MAQRTLVLYVAAYTHHADAELDYELVKRLYSGGTIAVYDATLFDRDAAGRARIVNTLAGLFFPPCLMRDASEAADETASDRFWRGLSADDLRQVGALCRRGSSWLIAIAAAPLKPVLRDPARSLAGELETTLTADDSAWNVSRTHHMR